MTDWAAHAAWWRNEVASDSAYDRVTTPLVQQLLGGAGQRLLDVGSGEGRVARVLRSDGHDVVGIDANGDLAKATGAPSVVGLLPSLSCFSDRSFDGAYAVLVVEHIADHRMLFRELARVVQLGGVLAVVLNHPVVTADGATTVVDPTDGEVFWRWGRYFDPQVTMGDGGEAFFEFHHRPLSDVLTAAAAAGWALAELVELPGDGEGSVAAGYRGIPVLAGVRWIRSDVHSAAP